MNTNIESFIKHITNNFDNTPDRGEEKMIGLVKKVIERPDDKYIKNGDTVKIGFSYDGETYEIDFTNAKIEESQMIREYPAIHFDFVEKIGAEIILELRLLSFYKVKTEPIAN